ncbi:AraC family transcriptional regulator [Beduini massiliensis]|uniref:AraC family transcriptional regulator n=1 Tax=Beduini massiliensis TaxID=1585974 RepID=UPI00059A9B6B|nr:GyrI-like domain-containing protein [Beduini massiliensis]
MEHYKSKSEYQHRINKVQDYIEAHPFESFTLAELAHVAGFSKYHFHRIFKAVTHESLSQYVHRFKLEKATHLLGQRDDMSITDIAYHLGFTDSAVFSRSFKQMYKISPNDYRKNYRKNCKDQYNISRYNQSVSDMGKSVSKEKVRGQVEIVKVEKMRVAYVRFTGNYGELAEQFSALLNRLFKIAQEQHLLDEKTKVLSVYHDHPEFTEPDYFKTSIAVTIAEDVKVDENCGLGVMELPAGQYLVGHFYIEQDHYSAAWDYIYEEWLTTSGYVPCDSCPFEMYMNDHSVDPNNMHLVDIYLPVEPIVLS